MKTKTQRFITAISVLILVGTPGVAFAKYSIPADQLQPTKIYYGTSESFEKPGKVRFKDIIKATPEYHEVKRDKIERGTGRYWILLSQASDRANRAIHEVGEKTDYDLIALDGYLGHLKPAIKADDITDLVIETMTESLNKK